jgi:hypothetical protein
LKSSYYHKQKKITRKIKKPGDSHFDFLATKTPGHKGGQFWGQARFKQGEEEKKSPGKKIIHRNMKKPLLHYPIIPFSCERSELSSFLRVPSCFLPHCKCLHG